MKSCGVSAVTGAGVKEYLINIETCVKEYYEYLIQLSFRVYAELLKEKREKAEKQKKKLAEENMAKFMEDLKITSEKKEEKKQ